MGEVYRARDTRLGQTVAIKVLRFGADPELLPRLDREARAASALNHPNIVQIYDVGEAASQSGAHYVVMEYVEGETLRRRLARVALAMPEVLDLRSCPPVSNSSAARSTPRKRSSRSAPTRVTWRRPHPRPNDVPARWISARRSHIVPIRPSRGTDVGSKWCADDCAICL